MTVSTVTMLGPIDNFPSFDLRPAIDVVWTGGVGAFDVRYEWDDNTSFTSPITVTNTSVTSPDSAVPTSDMGPIDTDWYCRVTVIDNDDAGEVEEPSGSWRTLTFEDADLQGRYLYLNHNIGVNFVSPDYSDGNPNSFSRFLYLNSSITSDQACPYLESISPTLQVEGSSVTVVGASFGASQVTYDGEVRLYESADHAAAHVVMSSISWSDTEIVVTVPSGASTGWVAVVHTNVGANCDGSGFKKLNVELTPPNPDMGWWIQTAGIENTTSASNSILPYNINTVTFQKLMNSIGSGMIQIPLSDPDIDEILDPIMRQGSLIRCYLDDVFRYAFFSEVLSHELDEEGNAIAQITGRGMEVVSEWTKILPHDYPASPSKNSTWVYGSNENFVQNPGFDDAADKPILKNPGGEDGNTDEGVLIGWTERGDDVTSLVAVKNSFEARSGEWYMEMDISDNHSGMEQSITVTPNKVYYVQCRIRDPLGSGMRVTMALGGADDIAATTTYTNNYDYNNEILGELDNATEGNGSTDGGWQVIDVEVQSGNEQTSLTIAIQNDEHSTSLFNPIRVDDVTIDGFGLGLDPWIAFEPSNAASSSFRLDATRTFDSSAYSCRVNGLTLYAGIEQYITVNELTKYTASIWGYTDSPAVDDTWKLVCRDKDDQALLGAVEKVPTDGAWTNWKVVFTTPANLDDMIFRFAYTGPNNPLPIYVDSASLVAGEDAAYAGEILSDVFTAFTAAGKLTYFTTPTSYTDELDSNGVPWPSKLSMDIDPSESLYGLLSRFVALGHEWEIVPVSFIEGGENGFILNVYTARAFNPDSGIGTSHTGDTGGPVITPGDATTSGRVIKTAFNTNTVFALGDDGVWSASQQFPYETGDIPAGDPAPLGYKESFGIIEEVMSVSSADTNTISEYAGALLSDSKGRERAIKLNMQRASDIRPFLDFAVGDSLYVDMPPDHPDPLDATTGLRKYPKRIRSIQAALSGEGTDVTFSVDVDRVIYEDELGWVALVAQLAERSPTETTGTGTGKASGSGGAVSVIGGGSTTTAYHTHDFTSTTITDRASSGDVSGELPGPLSVNKIKGMAISNTVPVAGTDSFTAFVYDYGSKVWVPTVVSKPDFNVKSYGAIGDGTTNDSVAVQAAIDAAEVAGGNVFFPQGTFDINVTIDSDNVLLQGSGAGTTLTSQSGTAPIVTFQNVDFCGARDFFLDGEWQGSAVGFLLEGCRFSDFSNLTGDRWTLPMIDLRADGSATQNTNNNSFSHIHALNAVRFLRFEGNAGLSQFVTLNQFFNCSAVGAGSVLSTLIDFAIGADNNHFVGVCRLSLNYAGSIGVVYNSDSPAATRAVYENHFDDLMLDQSVASTISIDMNDCTVSGSGPHYSRISYRPGGTNETVPDVAANGFVTWTGGHGATEVSAAATLDLRDGIVNVDTSGGTVTITLPDNTDSVSKSYQIRRDGGSAVTINRAGSDTFDDASTSKSLDTDSASIHIFSIGDTEWKIVGTEGTVT